MRIHKTDISILERVSINMWINLKMYVDSNCM